MTPRGPTLSGTSRALLEAARDGLGPDPATIARMRGRIAVAATTTPPTGVLAGKLGLVGLVAIAVVAVTGAGLLAHRARSAVTPSEAVAYVPPAEPVVSHHAVTAREPTAPVARAPRREQPHLEAVTRSRAERPPATRRDTGAAVRRDRPTVDLAREVELVDRAMVALRRGDTAAALAAVHLHARETANRGQLAEDAAAIEIETLCTVHDRRIARRLAAFDARWPDSAQRARLTAACR